MVLNMSDYKQYFKREIELYIKHILQGCSCTESERLRYIKKILRDKEYKQKLLSKKSEDVTIEIEVLNEMLGEEK